MRGLIYKEFSVFYKSIDKKMIAIAVGAIILLFCSAGSYGGFMASIMLAITIGGQNVLSFASDDKVCWKKYQMAMPLSSFSVVASKYIAVICTVGISFLGSVGLNLISSVISRSFDASLYGLAMFTAIFIPMMWTGVCLPLTYWFGMQAAQTMGLFILIPVWRLVKYFEDGAGLSAMVGTLEPYLWMTGIVTIVVFGISLGLSVMGYAHRK